VERTLFSRRARACVKTSGIWLFLQPYNVPLMEPFYDPHLQPSNTQKERHGVCVCLCSSPQSYSHHSLKFMF
jgi:hypothetical protein